MVAEAVVKGEAPSEDAPLAGGAATSVPVLAAAKARGGATSVAVMAEAFVYPAGSEGEALQDEAAATAPAQHKNECIRA